MPSSSAEGLRQINKEEEASPHIIISRLAKMLSLTVSKILTMVLTGVVPFCLGLLPRWISNTRLNTESLRHKIVVSCLLCFGGGVLLATSQVHMQMEVSVYNIAHKE